MIRFDRPGTRSAQATAGIAGWTKILRRCQKAVRAGAALWLVLVPAAAHAAQPEGPTAQSLGELQDQLRAILKETSAPGLSVAIVNRSGPEWVGGVGKANVATGELVTADTLFRIGSTSKAFTALAVQQLVAQGRLSLEDPVSRHVTDVPYRNDWEQTDPLRVVDLMEHTGGWNDLKFRQFAQQSPGWTLHQGLTFDTESHTSRWRPGTRMSYANAGTAMAAAVVEKVTGTTLEAYVQEHLFNPMGMATATYFEPKGVPAATLYHADGKTPHPYWHIIVRPAGSINASARDMAAYLGFYLNRGKVGDRVIVTPEMLDRAEVPTRTWAAQAGVKVGYGLHNYATIEDGFVFHGHDGGVNGGLTRMAYLPEAGIGYFASVNADNFPALQRASAAIRRYITRNLTAPTPVAAQPLPAVADHHTGWYMPDSPRSEMLRFLERLAGLSRVSIEGETLKISSLFGETQRYVAVGGLTFRRDADDPARVEPVATMALVDNADGRFLAFGGMGGTLRQVPTAAVLVQLLGLAWALLAILVVIAYAPAWMVGRWIRGPHPEDRALRLAGLATVLSLGTVVGTVAIGTADLLMNFGQRTPLAMLLTAATWAFALFAVYHAYLAFGPASAAARRWVRRTGQFTAVGLCLAAGYLGYWGVIGLRTWV